MSDSSSDESRSPSPVTPPVLQQPQPQQPRRPPQKRQQPLSPASPQGQISPPKLPKEPTTVNSELQQPQLYAQPQPLPQSQPPPQPQPPAQPQPLPQQSQPSSQPQTQLQPQPQRQASRSRHRGRSRTRRSPSVASTISDAGPEEILPNGEKRRKRKNKKRQQQNPLPVVNEIESTGREVVETAGGAVQTAGDTAGAVTQAVPSGGGSDKPLKLRLDLNLDADIRLTAKIHGDITLSLL